LVFCQKILYKDLLFDTRECNILSACKDTEAYDTENYQSYES